LTEIAAGHSNHLGGTLGLRRGDWRARVLLHHLPLALLSAAVILLFVGLPAFIASDARGDISSGPFPRTQAGAPERAGSTGHGSQAEQAEQAGMSTSPSRTARRTRTGVQQFTIATGYLAVGLIGLTLLVGPANLLLRRRNPVSNYLRRDLGAWAATAAVIHVILGVESYGIGFLDFFVDNGRLRTSSFGLGNWAGLAALVIAAGLLAISTDRSLRELKAGPWKRLQRLNYALFALAAAHAFFYGALLRTTSPFTLVLLCTVVMVLIGQSAGIRLWRHRHARPA
jgi:sulfoxide reductase heme-binding subunit YedZ